ncbi:hypothetical protein QBC43DRAFT_331509 [Cladorrhinum sp. PSN259]|nr:hypothetical protein QBC43DRAFT_331509 [Cladorrhinum sp. PSN259]
MSSPTSSISPTILPPFDPAINTLLFDVLMLFSYIARPSPHTCPTCERNNLKIAQRAVDARLQSDELPPNCLFDVGSEQVFRDWISKTSPASNVIDLWVNEPNQQMFVTTSFTGPDRSFPLLAAIRARHRLDHLGSFVELCSLWWCVAGRYTVQDAIHGRDFAEFVHCHRVLLGHLSRAGSDCEYFCLERDVDMHNYRTKSPEEQSRVIYQRIMNQMASPVRQIFEEVLSGDDDADWDHPVVPKEVREDGDKVRMLQAVAALPDVQRRMRNLRFLPEVVAVYKQMDDGMESWKKLMTEDPTPPEMLEMGAERITSDNFMRISRMFPDEMREEYAAEDAMRELRRINGEGR